MPSRRQPAIKSDAAHSKLNQTFIQHASLQSRNSQHSSVHQSHALASGCTATGLPRRTCVWTFLAACQVQYVPASVLLEKRAHNTTTLFKITPSSLAPRRRRQCCACRSSPVPAAPSLSRRAPLLLGAARAPLHPPASHTQSSYHKIIVIRVFLQLRMCVWGRVGAIICSS